MIFVVQITAICESSFDCREKTKVAQSTIFANLATLLIHSHVTMVNQFSSLSQYKNIIAKPVGSQRRSNDITNTHPDYMFNKFWAVSSWVSGRRNLKF